ncbi:hypothetical protein [Deinococcus multiflagellatus]|uniref:Uncharacterized protein n=1 Tax=Deinococcus multiflagellatus TaxID=1656887 RepID=A0ABW1ZRZ8_9DEIO|nr:hypothetical protein [Deinococcus multiflagellatus]MBZ9715284.1 hypothetical protein [Deinococcus multiflagellatus]
MKDEPLSFPDTAEAIVQTCINTRRLYDPAVPVEDLELLGELTPDDVRKARETRLHLQHDVDLTPYRGAASAEQLQTLHERITATGVQPQWRSPLQLRLTLFTAPESPQEV